MGQPRKYQVRPGQEFGAYTVIGEVAKRGRERFALCRCGCGVEKPVMIRELFVSACLGCAKCARAQRQKCRVVPDQEFGRWTVLRETRQARGTYVALCRCGCGVEEEVRVYALIDGTSTQCRACGHLSATRHGMHKTPEYHTWVGMQQRCNNPRCKDYPKYGARGISVAPEWSDFQTFYRDVGPRPSPLHSLDRIDNDGPYAPGNCRWAVPKTQNNNRRSNVWLTFQGRRLTLAGWAQETGVPAPTITRRLSDGWTVEEALATPWRQARNREPVAFLLGVAWCLGRLNSGA